MVLAKSGLATCCQERLKNITYRRSRAEGCNPTNASARDCSAEMIWDEFLMLFVLERIPKWTAGKKKAKALMDEGVRVANGNLDAEPAFRKFCAWARSPEAGGDLVSRYFDERERWS